MDNTPCPARISDSTLPRSLKSTRTVMGTRPTETEKLKLYQEISPGLGSPRMHYHAARLENVKQLVFVVPDLLPRPLDVWNRSSDST